jgi:transposase
MRKGIVVNVTAGDRKRLAAIVANRNSPQKHVWRARIVLLTADDLGTAAVMRQTGKSKSVVWRWQERFMQAGVDGLLRDKTRPSRKPPLAREVISQVIDLTAAAPPGEATHWTAPAMAKTVGISVSSVQRIWRGHGLKPHRVDKFKLSNDPAFAAKLKKSGAMSIHPITRLFSRLTRTVRFELSIAPNDANQKNEILVTKPHPRNFSSAVFQAQGRRAHV